MAEAVWIRPGDTCMPCMLWPKRCASMGPMRCMPMFVELLGLAGPRSMYVGVCLARLCLGGWSTHACMALSGELCPANTLGLGVGALRFVPVVVVVRAASGVCGILSKVDVASGKVFPEAVGGRAPCPPIPC